MIIPMTFMMTSEHLTLLRNSYVGTHLSPYETGAAWIDPKRPYGNSDVEKDIVRLMGWDTSILDEDSETYDQHEAARLVIKAMRLHDETPIALQIVLSTGLFEPGEYRRPRLYDTRTWVKCA